MKLSFKNLNSGPYPPSPSQEYICEVIITPKVHDDC